MVKGGKAWEEGERVFLAAYAFCVKGGGGKGEDRGKRGEKGGNRWKGGKRGSFI